MRSPARARLLGRAAPGARGLPPPRMPQPSRRDLPIPAGPSNRTSAPRPSLASKSSRSTSSRCSSRSRRGTVRASLGSPGDRSGTIPIAHAPRSANLSPLSERTIGEEPSRSSGGGYRGTAQATAAPPPCGLRNGAPPGLGGRGPATERAPPKDARVDACKRSGGCRGWLPVANQPRERQPGRMSPPTSVDEAQSQERRGVMSISTPFPPRFSCAAVAWSA